MCVNETFPSYAELIGIESEKYETYLIKSNECELSTHTLHPEILEALHQKYVS
jgi:hypothetical protein